MKESNEKKILEILQTQEFATVDALAGMLSASASTIRRTLDALQDKGLVTRTHGGVKINGNNAFSPSFTFRIHQNTFEKKKAALSAIKLIKNGDIIFLDGSTSAFYIAEYLKEFQNIRVITNGIDTHSLLSKYNIPAYSTGGQVSTENPSVLVGHYAEDMICNFHADIAFFSAQAMDNNGEIYDCYEEEIFLRRAMIKNAKTKVFLCDNTKFGKISPYHLCSLKDIDYIASNQALPDTIPTEKCLTL